jgi:hypothetical protein
MNERIEELNLQAMSIVMNGSDPDGDVDRMYIPSEFTKKFAELIVRECAKIADIADENKCEWIGGNILTHFGVKE